VTAIKVNHLQKIIVRVFGDQNLTKKASLNALTSSLEYAAKLLVAFIIQPWLVNGLGEYFYGTWQILLRFIGYIAPASGRPTTALRWALANQQSSSDIEKKRQNVGSALAVWLIFLPILLFLGGLLVWFVPIWIKTPREYVTIVRAAAGILVANLILVNLAAIPQSILQGENLGYKRMGASTLLVFLGGGFTWLAVYLKTGIAGVALAALLLTLVNGVFFLRVAARYVSWFGASRPSLSDVRKFFGISGWFLLWNLIMNWMLESDVVILGVFNSVESVTSYSLTKYAPELLISLIAIMVFGVAPGLGRIIGSQDQQRAAMVRGEMMALTWLVTTALGAAVILWNRAFMSLWVGGGHFPGELENLLIVLVNVQFVFIRNDSNFIDLTLNLGRKVLLGAVSLAASLGFAAVLVGYFRAGITGLCLGVLAGRLILSIGYPVIVGRFLRLPLALQLGAALKPALVTGVLFAAALILGERFSGLPFSGLRGWIFFALLGSATLLVSSLTAFFLGLSKKQRSKIIRRIKAVIAPG